MPVTCAPNVAAMETAYCAAKSRGVRLERLTTTSLSMGRPPSRRARLRQGRLSKLYASLSPLGRVVTRVGFSGMRLIAACWDEQALALAARSSFLRPIRPEFLEVGPQICDVLVVLDADEGHAGARHLLHRRADVFVERLPAPGDAGGFVGWGIIEALDGAGLAAVDAVERRAKLDFGIRPDVVTGGAQSLEHLLASGSILRQRGPGRGRKRNPSNDPRSHHFSPLSSRHRTRLGADLDLSRNRLS